MLIFMPFCSLLACLDFPLGVTCTKGRKLVSLVRLLEVRIYIDTAL